MEQKKGLPPSFKLERYFAEYEFNPKVKYLMCCSDAEALTMKELLDMADPESKALWENLGLGYTESSGHPLLRQEVGRMHGVESDQVLIITPQEGIYIAMHCLVDMMKRKYANCHAVVTFPAYQSLFENLKTTGVSVDYWSADLEEGPGWKFSIEKLRSLITTDTHLLVVNFPHNPSGFIPSEEMWAEIIQICKDKKLFLFSDEMYRLTNNDGSGPLPSACAIYEDSISLFGMSKTFALPGLRIGWLCSRNGEIMEMMQSFKDYTTICSSAPSEILSIIGLRNWKKLVERTLEINKKNLRILEKFFLNYSDLLEWHQPQAGTTALLKLKSSALLKWGSASGFCKALVEETGVLLVPGSVFDISDEYVRIGFGRKSIPDGLEVLKLFIEKHLS